MARTKQTMRKCTGGKHPRKQLATKANSVRKRKTPDNDALKGNETKRMKLNNNSVTTDESTSDESIMDIAPIPTDSNTLCTPMQTILDNIDTIINSTECDESQLKLFVKKLCNVANGQETKFKEMAYRKAAIPDFIRQLQYCHASDKIKKTAKAMLVGLRFNNFEERTEWEYGHQHFVDHSLDIALKSSHPHRKYVRKMRKLLKPYVGGIKDICSIICGYSRNGYRWYRLSATESTDDDGPCVSALDDNDGIMFNLEFDTLDYFKDNTYYKAHEPSASDGLVRFSKLRRHLACDELSNLDEWELSELIATISSAAMQLRVDKKWIEQCHNGINLP
eukprot:659878_1